MSEVFSSRLINRGAIRLGGADRRSFLQGLISNDIESCRPGQAVYAALLTPQGKFLHDLFIADAGEEFLIDCEAARADDLLSRLAAYKLRAKVTMEDAREDYEVWAFGDRHSAFSIQGLFEDPRLTELGMRAILPKEESPNAECRSPNAYDCHRLSLGVADGSRDMIIEKSTLAEGNFDFLNGISWSKGCYVGQELTARMRYRGLAKKRLFPVKIEGPAPDFGTAIKSGDEEIGDMRSQCNNLGLALLNIAKAQAAIEAGAALTCGASRLIASKPAWMNMNGEG